MKSVFKGKVFVLGDNIDTDQIIPAEHLVYNTKDEKESKLYGKYALSGVPIVESGLPKGGQPFVQEGSYTSEFNIVIGGKNFGCGSSREHAPLALSKAGVEIVIAVSYARIFFRNSVDGGFYPPVESVEDLSKIIQTGQEVEVDIAKNELRLKEKVYSLKGLGDIKELVEAGGIFAYARKKGLINPK